MLKRKNLLFLLSAVTVVVFCFFASADAAKGGGGCKDKDGDGFYQKDGCQTEVDCDDSDASIYPGAVEVCDSIDNNCDGTVDEGCGGCTDNDGDGYGNGPDCLGPDCDDTDPSINPGATEVCDDGVDNNCDGAVDENCGGCVPTAAKERGCDCFDNSDNDCDGAIDSLDRDCRKQTCDTCFDDDSDGWYTCGGDCDDSDPSINPGAPEVCNGIDDNCDNTLPIEEQDVDGDGVSICEGDCDDFNPNRSPNNTEEPFGHPVCSDGIDNDCDNLIDAGDPGCANPCIDNDNDGFGVNGDPSCPYPGIIDCDDTDPTINPLSIDLCDGIDRNCDGQTINDDDGDGFGVPASPYCTYNIEDCDDTDPTINPLGIDLCDGIDRNCDDQTINDDDNDGFGVPASPYCTYNIEDCDDTDPTINPLGIDLCDGIDRNCDGQTINDDDNDGFGVPASPYCTYNIEDCDDTDPSVNPFALEGPFGDPTCSDTKDNDCDGSTDTADPDCASPFCSDNTDCAALDYCEKPVGDCGGQGTCQPIPGGCTTHWAPVCGCDGVTYSNDCMAAMAGISIAYTGECTATCPDADGDGYTTFDDDCDDSNPNIHPGITEGPPGEPNCADGVDNDCNNLTDSEDGNCITCFYNPDNDGDGYFLCSDNDCDDSNPLINRGVAEVCNNGIDDDCDGLIDTMDPECGCTDADGDGYSIIGGCCGPVDCNDNDPAINTGAQEDCSNGIDDDCDGLTDSNDPDCLCYNNSECSTTEYCEKVPGNCSGQGTCQIRYDTCTTIFDPVCGCDGITYSNAGCAAVAGVNVAYQGTCL